MDQTGKTGGNMIYPELSYTITGLCFEVQKELGRFAREKQYCDGLEKKLIDHKILYKREMVVGDTGNRIDFIVDDKILLEIKAIPFIGKDEYYQTQRYLKVLQLKLGLLINFQSRYLKPQRVVNFELKDS